MTPDGLNTNAARSPEAAAAAAVVASVALRPWLWPAAGAEALRMAKPGWWRRWPPLPLPDPALWRFRLETAYGKEGDGVPDPRDIRSFLLWCRRASDWRQR
jgi:hypothetical protein